MAYELRSDLGPILSGVVDSADSTEFWEGYEFTHTTLRSNPHTVNPLADLGIAGYDGAGWYMTDETAEPDLDNSQIQRVISGSLAAIAEYNKGVRL